MEQQSLLGWQRLGVILRDHWPLVIGVTLATIALVGVWTWRTPPHYVATTTLIIDFHQPADAGSATPLAPVLQPNYLATQLGIIASRPVAERVVARLGLAQAPGWLRAFREAGAGQGEVAPWIADSLLGNLTVEPGRNSRLVRLSYRAGDPAFAAEVVNAFAAAYRALTLELATAPAELGVSRYEAALADLRQRLGDAQQRLSAFEREHGVLLTDERTHPESARLQALIAQRLSAEDALRAAQSKRQQVTRIRAEGGSLATLSEVLSDGVVQDLKGELGRKAAAFAELQRRVGDQHPRYQQLSAEIASLRAKLGREIEDIVASLDHQVEEASARVAAAQQAEQAQQQRALDSRGTLDELPALVRELESAQRNYDEALAQRHRYLMQSGLSVSNVAVLTPALAPAQPAGPGWLRQLSLATLGGLLLGALLALLRELSDRRVRAEADLQELAGVAYLGRLPSRNCCV